jgi:outer membrane protein TolC
VHEGVTTDLDVANASAQAESIESLIPTLESRCETTINAIGVLLGEEPGALAQTLAEPHDVPELPAQVPIGFPSELVQRRPDIRQAEAQLHAATASIGMAKADFYPRISLNGSAGFQSSAALEPRQLGVGTVCCRTVDHAADLRRRPPQGDTAPARGATTGGRDRLQTHRT